MLQSEALELADKLPSQTSAEIGVETQLDGLQPELLEASDLELRERLVGHIRVRTSAPQSERLTQHDRSGRRVELEQATSLADELLEPGGVDRRGLDLEDVSGRPGQ